MAITIKNMGGGAELTGNATTDNVLQGKTFYNTDGTKKLEGTMPNNGAITQTLEPQQTFYVPKGYHDGDGTVKGLGHTDEEYDKVVGEKEELQKQVEELNTKIDDIKSKLSRVSVYAQFNGAGYVGGHESGKIRIGGLERNLYDVDGDMEMWKSISGSTTINLSSLVF